MITTAIWLTLYLIWSVVFVLVLLAILLIVMVLGPELLYLILYAWWRLTGVPVPIQRLLQGSKPC